jgi:hypothetical protein
MAMPQLVCLQETHCVFADEPKQAAPDDLRR